MHRALNVAPTELDAWIVRRLLVTCRPTGLWRNMPVKKDKATVLPMPGYSTPPGLDGTPPFFFLDITLGYLCKRFGLLFSFLYNPRDTMCKGFPFGGFIKSNLFNLMKTSVQSSTAGIIRPNS